MPSAMVSIVQLLAVALLEIKGGIQWEPMHLPAHTAEFSTNPIVFLGTAY